MNSLRALALLAVLALLASCSGNDDGERSDKAAPASLPEESANLVKQDRVREYVGSKNCHACHDTIVEEWQGSHHALAIQEANQNTVLGQFDDQTVEHLGETFRFYKEGDKYFVRTQNIEGSPENFEISYTFGVTPLQQYLIALDNGAYQALSMAWDSRTAEQGGQRWYHLYPDEPMPFTDPLHWTRLHQNWNFQCADCHSTNLRKQYNAESNSYDTVFSELNVACEACHGPASQHLDWASDDVGSDLAQKGFAADLQQADVQIDSCARCHSRRRVIREGFEPGKPLYDHYVPSLLEQGLYHADGQIDDEVYVYGSFKQSKMYQAGVKCSNCHNPHSATLRLEGNAVCTQCHTANPPAQYAGLKAKNYDSAEHHFHPQGSEGSQCRNCHMPAKTYMGVDERYDHSFRIPRPQQSAAVDAPDVCASCHEGKSAGWASDIIAKHHGQSAISFTDVGSVFHKARQGLPVNELLLAISSDSKQTAIARASALVHMAFSPDAVALREARKQIHSGEPAIQLAALRLTENIPISERWNIVSPLLSDKHLAVRIEAARILADAPGQFLKDNEKQKLQMALEEFRQSQLLNADRPDALSNLASVALRQGDAHQAEQHYRQAIKLDPSWVPAYLNLADLYRSTGRDPEAEPLFSSALKQAGGIAEVHHAYGLWLSRQSRAEDSLQELQQAANLSDTWRYKYVYAIGLNSNGRAKEAERVLQTSLVNNPGNAEILFALAAILRDQQQYDKALQYALQLASSNPNDPRAKGLIRQLRSQQMNAK